MWPLSLGNGLKLAALGVAFFSAFLFGQRIKQAQWDRAASKAMAEQIEVMNESQTRVQSLNRALVSLQRELDGRIQERNVLVGRLQDAVNRQPVTQIVQVEGDCPDILIVDPGQHYRLFNCAVDPANCDAGAGEAIISDGRMPGPEILTTMDGHRRFNE